MSRTTRRRKREDVSLRQFLEDSQVLASREEVWGMLVWYENYRRDQGLWKRFWRWATNKPYVNPFDWVASK
jgi:hypothetical protein